jgi:hypothetical protein
MGFLLIEVFRKLFNTENYGHQGSLLGGLFYFVFPVDISDQKSNLLTRTYFFMFYLLRKTHRNPSLHSPSRLWGFFCYKSGFPVNTPNTPFFYHQNNARGFLRRM